MIENIKKIVYTILMKKILFFLLTMIAFLPAMVFSQETQELTYPPTAILTAAYSGDAHTIRQILETNPDIDVRDSVGGTALHLAVFKSSYEVIRLLLAHGFDINAVDTLNGFTPLHYCVRFNNTGVARYLLANNADRNIKDKDNLTPLEKARKEAKRDMIILLSQ